MWPTPRRTAPKPGSIPTHPGVYRLRDRDGVVGTASDPLEELMVTVAGEDISVS